MECNLDLIAGIKNFLLGRSVVVKLLMCSGRSITTWRNKMGKMSTLNSFEISRR